MAFEESDCRWFVFPKPAPGARIRLFCFPYAGGTALTYRTWPDSLSGKIEVCAIQIPGRGVRIHEKPLTDLRVLVKGISEALTRYLDRPFAFFGHSMGALTAFELASLMQRERGLEPLHLFVSASRAPRNCEGDIRTTFDLPEPEFIDHLRRLNGTPKEVLEHAELMQLMVPMLRADFQLVQTYRYRDVPALRCPITAFGGLEDKEIEADEPQAWRSHTTGSFNTRILPGDHFFLHTGQQRLLHLIETSLQDS